MFLLMTYVSIKCNCRKMECFDTSNNCPRLLNIINIVSCLMIWFNIPIHRLRDLSFLFCPALYQLRHGKLYNASERKICNLLASTKCLQLIAYFTWSGRFAFAAIRRWRQNEVATIIGALDNHTEPPYQWGLSRDGELLNKYSQKPNY